MKKLSIFTLAAVVGVWAPYSFAQQERRSPARDQSDRVESRQPSQQQEEESWTEAWTNWWSDWWNDDESENVDDQQRSQSGAGEFVRRHDRDDDGYLSPHEMPRNMRADFHRLDANEDDYLSRAEIQRHARAPHRRAPRKPVTVPLEVTYIWVIESNTGRIKLDDLQQAYDLLQEIDEDGNGEITRHEMNASREQVVSQWLERHFDRHDQDGDGDLSRSEAKDSVLGTDFQKYDRNDDRYLTKQEVRRQLMDHFRPQGSASRNRSEGRR